MTAPRPAGLVQRDVVVLAGGGYWLGSWRWDRSPRLELDGRPVSLRDGPDGVIDRALEDPRVRHYLTWSRYPYAAATAVDGGWLVRIGDVRYPGRGSLGGLEVRVDDGPATRPAPPAGTPR
jgi:hypothetical protein